MFGREWTDDVPLSFRMGKKDNDREISEWYNEVKLGRQIGIWKERCIWISLFMMHLIQPR